ncbi:hypothetical protein FACS1894190_07170 [Spirochaetia bacterium]|nr:hypothetical protein FACS1894190_07170 [Spirochaetia bacterium]
MAINNHEAILEKINLLKKIDSDINKLQEEIKNIPEQHCEVYARIVGYYRSLRAWNKGKAEEYKERVCFVPCPAYRTNGETVKLN